MAAMMAAARLNELGPPFDDQGSINASLEDFEEQDRRSPLFDLPSQHSGFRSDHEGSEMDDRSSSGAPWSPPGYKMRASNASSWFRHDPYGRLNLRPSPSPSRSRQTSLEYQDAEEGDADITLAANIPLPPGTDSPFKDRSPEPEFIANDDEMKRFDNQRSDQNPNNFIRFAMRAEVQHREPFVPMLNFVRNKINTMTSTKTSTIMSVIIALVSISIMRIILVPPIPPPVPDLVKLSNLARSFEPLIFYSENGVMQITALQETSVAVWDLGESVRTANMTSAPMIGKGLDELSDSLKTLGVEMTRFFADVDSDVDAILIVMDWARRELMGVSQVTGSSVPSRMLDHVHNILNHGGLLESATGPTSLGKMLTMILGSTTPQRTRLTLTRTFHEFLNVLEESINSELTHSAALFALFESIDRQFLNLQRIVVRESDTQERLENDMLSSLWTRVMGPNSARLKKFEKNKQLLASVHARTVANKHLLVQHNGRLSTLKANLETLRKRLFSPIIRRNDSVTLGIDNASVLEGQIKGLEGTYEYLQNVRDKQKSKLMEMIYGAKPLKSKLIEELGIEGSK